MLNLILNDDGKMLHIALEEKGWASPLPVPRQGSLLSYSLPLPQCPEWRPARGQDLPPPELGPSQSRRAGRPSSPLGYTAETQGLTCCPQEGGSLGPPRFLWSEVWQGRPPPGDAPGREGRLSSGWVGGAEGGPLRGGEGQPPSSRAEGLLFLHGLESNPGSSLQTEEEAGLP